MGCVESVNNATRVLLFISSRDDDVCDVSVMTIFIFILANFYVRDAPEG